MEQNSLILVGNPDSGKSNYIGRLWLALQSKKFPLVATCPPDNIKYVEGIAEHLLQGRFAPRTEKEESNRDFNVTITLENNTQANLLIPDVSGELWKKAVETLEISEHWLKALKDASGALLFVRVLSDTIVEPLDWVNSKEYLEAGLIEARENQEMPTQISLIELLRILEENLKSRPNSKPKIAIIITAWDLLNIEDAASGPLNYLEQNYPLLAGRLKDVDSVEVAVFGSSILGGDFLVDEFVKEYEASDTDDLGYIVANIHGSNPSKVSDITLPVAWLLGQV